jgi:predicted MPP superfamily phosphohydrolase
MTSGQARVSLAAKAAREALTPWPDKGDNTLSMSRAAQMSFFLLIYVLIYSAMNAYMLLRARWAFEFGARDTLWAACLCAFMVAAPVLVRVFESRGLEVIARPLAFLAFTWFGLVFLFVSAGLAMEIYRLGALAAGKGVEWRFYPGASLMFWGPLALSLALFVYGYFEGSAIKVERVEMTSEKMNPMRRKVRIAQISDIHIGLMTGEKRIRRIVDILREENPDIIVSTGDLVDGDTFDSDSLAEFLASLSPRYGMYAVMGNHEYYAGLGKAIAFTENSGFRVLRSEAVGIDTLPLSIAGADFVSSMSTGGAPESPDPSLFDGLPEDNFNLLLKHIPKADAAGVHDLQLSGHTHKGQIFPFSLVVRMFYPRLAGLYFMEGGSWLYVSRGTGVWGPPIRVLASPEITMIEIAPDIRD